MADTLLNDVATDLDVTYDEVVHIIRSLDGESQYDRDLRRRLTSVVLPVLWRDAEGCDCGKGVYCPILVTIRQLTTRE